MLQYSLYKAAQWLSRAIPRPFAYWLSLRTADLYFFLDRRGREAVIDNLRHVLRFAGREASESELRLKARRTFQYFGKYLVDFFRFARLSERDMRELVSVEHPEYIAQARDKGRGVILVTAHLGNWELGGAVLASMGFKVNAVALQQSSAKLNEFFQHHRRQRGMAVIPLGHAVPDLIRALRRREFVALLADRDYSRRSDYVTLCGAAACLPRGPAWLAEKTGAPILAGFMLRNADETFTLRFYPPIDPAKVPAGEIQRSISAILEDCVRRDPDQWFMFERVWSGRSYGQASGEIPVATAAPVAPS